MNNDGFRGSKYDTNLTRKQIAALVRTEIKAAITSGELPKGIKVSVRMSKGGSTIYASIESFSGAVLNPAEVFAGELNHWEYGMRIRNRARFTAPVRKAQDAIEAIMNAYRRDDSDLMTDYFSCNFYASVDVRVDTKAERAALLASEDLADLRVSKASGIGADHLSHLLDGHDTSGDVTQPAPMALNGVEAVAA